MTGPAPARLFFALWPEPSLRAALAQRQREWVRDGRPVPVSHLHLTVLFLGDADPALAERVAEGVRVPSFELTLCQVGHWANGIHWLAPLAAPAELLRLNQGLQSGLEAQGLRFDSRPYRPHVTLARKAGLEPTHAIPPLRWPVTDYALVESRVRPEGANYRVLRRWPLA